MFFCNVILIAAFIVVSNSCTCGSIDLFHSHCISDIVAHVKVKKIEDIPFRRVKYEVEYVETLKKPSRFEKLDGVYVYDNLDSSMCGVGLTLNAEYILFGKMDSDGSGFYINSCGPNKLYSDDVMKIVKKFSQTVCSI